MAQAVTVLIAIFAAIGFIHVVHEVWQEIKKKLNEVKEIDDESMDY